MHLYCLVIENDFGHGQAVTAEKDASLIPKIMQLFKEENPAWSSVHVIVVDKTSQNGRY